MKNLRFPLIFIAVAAVTLGQPKEINEDFAAVVDSEGRLRALIKRVTKEFWKADKCFLR